MPRRPYALSRLFAAGALIMGLAAMPGLAATGETDRHGGSSLFGNYLAGKHAQAARDLDAAAVYLGAALLADPGSVDLLRRTYLVMLADGRIADAVVLAERLVAVRPEDTIAHLTLAIGALKRGDHAAAEAALAKLDNGGVSRFFKPLIQGWVRYAVGDTDAALAALAPLAGEQATQALHDSAAGMMHALDGDWERAIDRFVTVTELQGGFALRNTEHLGAIYEIAGDARKAEALYNSFLAEFPTTRLMNRALARVAQGGKAELVVRTPVEGVAEGLYGVASSLGQQNAPETSLILGQLAAYLRPEFPGLHLMIGDLMNGLYGAERANEAYRKVAPDSDYAWSADLRLAGNLADLGRTEDAEALLRTMAETDPSSPDPLIDLGDLMRSESRFEDAVDAYDAAFARIAEPGERFWSLYYARGIALERSKQWDRAEADFLTALEFEPDQPLVLNYLGYSWVELERNLEQAQAMIRKAVELRPNDGYIVDSLGWVYYRLGDYANAVVELERAVELRPEDPIINDHLGDAYWRIGRTREARFQWLRSLSLEPDEEMIPTIERKIEGGLEAAAGDDVSDS